MKKNKEFLKELIKIARGYTLTNVITAIGKSGAAEKLLNTDEFSQNSLLIKESKSADAIMNYLIATGLIRYSDKNTNCYKLTSEGKFYLERWGLLGILSSYNNLFASLGDATSHNHSEKLCNRALNISGSAAAHKRSYFKRAIQLLENYDINDHIDLGCGDGTFIKELAINISINESIGIDLSKIAITQSYENLIISNKWCKNKNCHQKLEECNILNIEKWSQLYSKDRNTASNALISIWFILHEISNKDKSIITNFLRNLRKYFPCSKVIIGEFFSAPSKILSENKDHLITPEFLFFHELSNQGVLEHKDYLQSFCDSGYQILNEINFGNINYHADYSCPSSSIWLLEPLQAEES
tara:strand:- start:5048 stop:6115 length:1068 start_codon:yes stop_codon:yes gene_type:complete